MNRTSLSDRRAMLTQLARYAMTGVGVTLASAGGYWVLATAGGIDPALSFTIVFVIFTVVGYLLHSVVSFRGHGARDRQAVRGLRYFAINLMGFAINQGFIWLFVTYAGRPAWVPIIPMVVVTPLISFGLHRRWVFSHSMSRTPDVAPGHTGPTKNV
jgi:putative flippase GtrA